MGVDWYYKGGLIVGLVWGAARALGAYGEQARDLDINFVYGFLLTTGGWAAVFFVIDRVAKFLGWKRPTPSAEASDEAVAPEPPAAPQPTKPAARRKR